MEKPARRPSRPALPLGLLGMLALVAAVERGVARHESDFMDSDDVDWTFAARWADGAARGAELICLGDSLVKAAVVPPLIEARTGRTAYNLAVAGGQTPAAYFLLRRLLEGGRPPRALIVEFFPKLLELEPGHNLDNWPRLLRPRDALELAWAARDPEFLAAVLARRLLPSLGSREEVRESLLAAVAGKPMTLSANWLTHLRHARLHRGAVVLPEKDSEGVYLAGWYGRFFGAPTPSPVNRAYLERLLDLAAEARVPVVWVLPPARPDLQAALEWMGDHEDWNRFLADLQARHAHLIVVDGRRGAYRPEAFFDLHHVGRRGAYAFSAALGDVLRHRLRDDGWHGPRWVELPRYVEPPNDVALEDIDRTQAVLLERFRRR